ncbi:hypothetical protein ALC56_13787 [Trachymyrmex septentrionalis]|uniref:Uncharacterized protein n=1 Tax=Trachymyrmex septentrionalis TaxID=34720 RepID=A0A151JTM3_9HYME|nr:hypothetical protein ALC56_13787 [Trachymyrmex septentrionalis]
MHRFVGTSESAVDCEGSIKPVFSPTRFKDIAPAADVVIDRLSGLVCEWSRLDWSSGCDDLDTDTVTLDRPAILPCSCFRPSRVCLESDSIDSLSDDLFLSASATFARADSFGGRLGGRLEIDACAASSLNARSLSLSSRRADGLDFLASPRPFDANIPLSPDFEILGLSRPRLKSVTPELVFGEPEALEDELFDKGFPATPPVADAVIPALLPVFVVLEEEMADFIPEAANIIFVGSIFCAACNVCGFFDAGPEFTPGLRPVCVFGEPLLPVVTLLDDDDDEEATDDKELEDEVAAIDPDDDSFKLAACLESLVRVLLIVIFIPSELCFTMYSPGFFVSTDAFLVTQDFPPSPIAFPPLDDEPPPLPIFFSFCPALLIPPVLPSPEDPLPFTLPPPFPQASVSRTFAVPCLLGCNRRFACCIDLTRWWSTSARSLQRDLDELMDDVRLSLSPRPEESLLEDDEEEDLTLDGVVAESEELLLLLLLDGEFAADFKADILGLPLLAAELPCFGDEVLPCFGLALAGTGTGTDTATDGTLPTVLGTVDTDNDIGTDIGTTETFGALLPLLLPLPLVKLFITAGKERPSQIFNSIRIVNGMLRQRCSTLPLRSDVCSTFVVILMPYNRHLSVDMSVRSSSAVAIVSSYGCSTLTLMCCHERALTSSIVVCSGS